MINSRLLLTTTAIAGLALAAPAQAATAQSGVCPAISLLVENTSCNVEVFLNGPSSASTVIANATPYDGSDDALVGIVNDSGSTVSSLTFSGSVSGTGIFAFDGDGLQTYLATTTTPSSTAYANDPDTTGYGGMTSTGQFVTFTNISADETAGTVVFGASGLANGATAYFSLEGQPGLTLTPGGYNGGTGGGSVPVPEPAGALAFVAGILGLGFARKRRAAARG